MSGSGTFFAADASIPPSGSVTRVYTHGPGIDNILSMTVYGATTNTYYYLKDHLGSVLGLVDKDGTLVESYRYDAWGRVLGVYTGGGQAIATSAFGNRYLWQGREYSWKTGLYFFRARWYDPVTGRWLSNDPIGISGGLNQYVFCANNAMNFTDPEGLDTYLITVSSLSEFQASANATAKTIESSPNFVKGVDSVAIREAASGKALIAALNEFSDKARWQHLSHGNETFFQAGNNDFVTAKTLGVLPTGGFTKTAYIELDSCLAAKGKDSIAQLAADHFGRSVRASASIVMAANNWNAPPTVRLRDSIASRILYRGDGGGWRMLKPRTP